MARLAFFIAKSAYDVLGRPPEDDYVALVTAERPLPQYWMKMTRLASQPRDHNTRSLFLSALDLDADFVIRIAAEHLQETGALSDNERGQLDAVLQFLEWGRFDAQGHRVQFFR